MRKYVLCMLLLLLLTACQSSPRQAESPTPEPTPTPAVTVTPTPEPTPSPTPEPTSVGIEVDIGDGEHKFWVEAELGDWCNEFEKEVTISIYCRELDQEPVQVIETTMISGFLKLKAVDADFDGDMDFYFPCQVGANNGFYSFWLWDGETGTFIEEKAGLGSLSYPYFEPEEKLIRSHMLDSATCSTDFIYTWREGELVCLRSVYHAYSEDMETVQVMVWDEELGTIENTYPRDSNWTQWLDLDYHGE